MGTKQEAAYGATKRPDKHWQNQLLCDETERLVRVNLKAGVTTSPSAGFLVLDAETYGTTRTLLEHKEQIGLVSLEQVIVPNPNKSMLAAAKRVFKLECAQGYGLPWVLPYNVHHHLTVDSPANEPPLAFVYLDYTGTWGGRRANPSPTKYCHPDAEIGALFQHQRMQDGAVLALTLLRGREAGMTGDATCGAALASIQRHAISAGYGVRLRHLVQYTSPAKRGKKKGSPMVLIVCWVFKRDLSMSHDTTIPGGIWDEWTRCLANLPPVKTAKKRQPSVVGDWFLLPGRKHPARYLSCTKNGCKRYQCSKTGAEFGNKLAAADLTSYACAAPLF
jgi:hypothetical protein